MPQPKKRAARKSLSRHAWITLDGGFAARHCLVQDISDTGAKITLDEAVTRVQAMRDAAAEVRPDILVLCHGGPIAEPDDAAYVIGRTTGIDGFFGASSMERLPTEVAMTENMKRFKAIPTAKEQ